MAHRALAHVKPATVRFKLDAINCVTAIQLDLADRRVANANAAATPKTPAGRSSTASASAPTGDAAGAAAASEGAEASPPPHAGRGVLALRVGDAFPALRVGCKTQDRASLQAQALAGGLRLRVGWRPFAWAVPPILAEDAGAGGLHEPGEGETALDDMGVGAEALGQGRGRGRKSAGGAGRPRAYLAPQCEAANPAGNTVLFHPAAEGGGGGGGGGGGSSENAMARVGRF